MKINRKDLFFAVAFPLIPTALFLVVFFILRDKVSNTEYAYKTVESVISFFKQFSLTILGVAVTVFSLLQLLQSKDWYSAIKETRAFENLILKFKACIIFCFIGMFLPFLFEIILFATTQDIMLAATLAVSLWTMGFICCEVWQIIKTFVAMLKE